MLSHSRFRRRPGFSLVELLVVMAIIATLSSLLLVAVHHGLVVAQGVQCTAHQKNLGLALYMYHDAAGSFPSESDSGQSFYVSILDFVDGAYMSNAVQQQGQSAAEPLPAFLCPARRSVRVGAKDDYGFGSGQSILGASAPVSATMVAGADGVGNTLLLSHKGISPRHYDGSGPGDTGWATLDHMRDPDRLVKDSNDQDMSSLIGSPHPLVSPSLFADGGVRKVPYASSSIDIRGMPFMAVLWSYNDGRGVGAHLP